MAGGVRITVVRPKAFDRQIKLVRQWPERLKKIQPMVAYMGADYVMRMLQAKIPKGNKLGGYRDALEVVRVRGTKSGEYAYSIQIDPRSHKVKQLKPHNTLIYVKVSKRAKRPSPLVQLLADHSPWTYQSLPFTPKKTDGYLVTRKASTKKILQVNQKRERERPEWTAAMTKHGYRNTSRDKRLKIPKSAKMLPDVALDALKLEFGLGETKPRPFWRTAFRSLARQAFKGFLKDNRLLAFPLTKPSFSLWKKFPTKTRHTISMGEARKFKAFQQKVAVRS